MSIVLQAFKQHGPPLRVGRRSSAGPEQVTPIITQRRHPSN